MNRRRVIGMSIVAAAFLWFQVAGFVESQRIEAQRGTRPPGDRAASLRIDSERLMTAVRTLADPKLEGRRTGTPGNLTARDWIENQFKQIGLPPVSGAYVFPFHFTTLSVRGIVDPDKSVKNDFQAANVVAQCLGTSPSGPVFVLSAHFDHLGVRNGQVYPGADDNASGVAVMLAIADYCKKTPFTHTVLFAALDGEEQGLQGAKAFVATPPVPIERIALDINLDMVSRNDKRELFAAGTYQWPLLKAPLEAVAKRAPITLLFGHDKPMAIAGGVEDWTNQSDHGPFNSAKIPFVYFGVEDHADYHKPTDTADKIDRGFFVDVAETILDAVQALDSVDRLR